MGVNDFQYYYDFAKIYRNFKRFVRDELVDDTYFEKKYYKDIMDLLFCIMKHYDFTEFLKEYNKCRLKDIRYNKKSRYDYVMDRFLVEFIGGYFNGNSEDFINNKNYDNHKVGFSCYLLDGILCNMWNWKV